MICGDCGLGFLITLKKRICLNLKVDYLIEYERVCSFPFLLGVALFWPFCLCARLCLCVLGRVWVVLVAVLSVSEENV